MFRQYNHQKVYLLRKGKIKLWVSAIGTLLIPFILLSIGFAQQTSQITPEKSKVIREAEERQREHRSIFRPDRQWYHYLPPCPCRKSDVSLNDWLPDEDGIIRKFLGAGLQYYHPGAAYSFRSARTYVVPKGSKISKGHGQQCTYDRDGYLLVFPKPGAGTPDFVSPNVSLLGHRMTDVNTWEILGHEIYNRYWVPNYGCEAAFNVLIGQVWDVRVLRGELTKVAHSLEFQGMRDTVLDVKSGDSISFDAKGKVVWGAGGSVCGPEGSNKDSESTLGFLVAPPLFAALTNLSGQKIHVGAGALFGAIQTGTKFSDIFYIGRGGTYRAKNSGRLWLGINDGYPQNNSGYFDVQIKLNRRR
jgi:hypothetical protein